MTKPCVKCGSPVEEDFLVYGRCHGCRVDFREQQASFVKDRGRNSLARTPEKPGWDPGPSISERLRWAAERLERQNRTKTVARSHNSDDIPLDEWTSKH